MIRSTAALALIALAATACSRSAAPAAQPSVSPAPSAAAAPAATPTPAASAAGTYDFSTSAQGMTIGGTIVITFNDGKYGGTIVTDATPEMPVKSVTMKDGTIVVTAATPDGDAVIDMKMNGNEFTGSWTYAGQGGTLSGKKRG